MKRCRTRMNLRPRRNEALFALYCAAGWLLLGIGCWDRRDLYIPSAICFALTVPCFTGFWNALFPGPSRY